MQFSNSYVQLGEAFYQSIKPSNVEAPELFLWNPALAQDLGIDFEKSELAKYFSGNELLEGSEPIAMAYAGHQFGQFNPQLGDGRAHLLGELLDENDKHWDIQLKGSGPTAFSRRGDGRCGLGPAIREFIMSASMEALNVPTTKALAVTTTGETVIRDGYVPGAVVTRVASSHIRVGTFQYFAAKQDMESLQALADYTIDRHFSQIRTQDGDPLLLLLESAIDRQINLIVQWMRVGFIHGVMNTDNCAISGETIDFGPCAMMGVYNPKQVFSSIDTIERYAFENQSKIANWNMVRFAESLLMLSGNDKALIGLLQNAVNDFSRKFNLQYQLMMAAKIGLCYSEQETVQENDVALIEQLLKLMEENQLDFTKTFLWLTNKLDGKTDKNIPELNHWYETWFKRINEGDTAQSIKIMKRSNPVVIPRNHHMEAVIDLCITSNKPDAALAFLEVLKKPYEQSEKAEPYQQLPLDNDRNYQTFCGT